MRNVTDPKVGADSQRHYREEDRMEMIAKVILLVVVALVCGLIVAFGP